MDPGALKFEFVPSLRRRGKNLIVEGFRFKKNLSKPKAIHFICVEQNCRSRLIMDFDQTKITTYSNNQTHDPDFEYLAEHESRHSIFEMIDKNPTQKIKSLYMIAVENATTNAIFLPPPFSKIRTSLIRRRNRQLPPIPHSFRDVDIVSPWSDTFDCQSFLLDKNNERGIVIFISLRALSYLSKSSVIFCDGTFKTAPRPYEQIYTVFAVIDEKWKVPVCWSLMNGKTEDHYKYLLQTLSSKSETLVGVKFELSSLRL